MTKNDKINGNLFYPIELLTAVLDCIFHCGAHNDVICLGEYLNMFQ